MMAWTDVFTLYQWYWIVHDYIDTIVPNGPILHSYITYISINLAITSMPCLYLYLFGGVIIPIKP